MWPMSWRVEVPEWRKKATQKARYAALFQDICAIGEGCARGERFKGAFVEVGNSFKKILS